MEIYRKEIARVIESVERRMTEARYSKPRSQRDGYDDHRQRIWDAQADAVMHILKMLGKRKLKAYPHK